MPSNATAKTASAPKRWWWLAVPAGLLVGLLIASLLLVHSSTRNLELGSHRYRLEVAQTETAQEKGLGDRDSLPENQGMLFVFADQATRCFWMKDMHFSLDMIWLDSARRVVFVQPNISPQTYPKTFCPATPAQYVIELNVGQAQVAGIITGQTLKF